MATSIVPRDMKVAMAKTLAIRFIKTGCHQSESDCTRNARLPISMMRVAMKNVNFYAFFVDKTIGKRACLAGLWRVSRLFHQRQICLRNT